MKLWLVNKDTDVYLVQSQTQVYYKARPPDWAIDEEPLFWGSRLDGLYKALHTVMALLLDTRLVVRKVKDLRCFIPRRHRVKQKWVSRQLSYKPDVTVKHYTQPLVLKLYVYYVYYPAIATMWFIEWHCHTKIWTSSNEISILCHNLSSSNYALTGQVCFLLAISCQGSGSKYACPHSSYAAS